MDNLLNELQKFGFSKYECQVYVGFLKNSPITGYEVSKRTGVPRSMIYQVLGKLLDKGAIFTIPSDPVKYIPLPAKDLIDRLRKEYEQSFDYLEKELTSLDSEQEADIIWRVKSDELVLKEIIELIERAQEELWISVWEPQVSIIKEFVDKRVEAGVKAFSVLFGAPETEIGLTYHHNYMALEIAKERTDGHLTIVARDNEEVIIANFSPNTVAWAVKTKDPALVLVATEYIRHDIMYGEIAKAFGSEKVDHLWKNNIDLTHIVTGKRFKYK
ncbi:TrmB family transcriptional regulator [Planococcus shixiaomingii]|uniref:TrmB family transcriptional regulator n=1 Tax=Planococcus shixiaomingii TaxID=3058393 RepID=UPI0026379B65|nr:helix-turn-helix domain-containing protein [Planococcus sp. N022]WKA56796.1 helix-turn-helix domain-containing protein [Planococcus sp. N022]